MNTNALEGIQCPKCKQSDEFSISCFTACRVTDEGVTESVNPEWDKDSPITCPECDHEGTVGEFMVAAPSGLFEKMVEITKIEARGEGDSK